MGGGRGLKWSEFPGSSAYAMIGLLALVQNNHLKAEFTAATLIGLFYECI